MKPKKRRGTETNAKKANYTQNSRQKRK